MSGAALRREHFLVADNCDKRAVELADREDVETISRVLICHPEAIRHIQNKLRNMGYKLDDFRGTTGKSMLNDTLTNRKQERGSVQNQGYAKRATTLKDKEETAVSKIVNEDGTPVPRSELVPCKYWHLEEMTATYWQSTVLPAIEPIACSGANLRGSVMGRGRSESAAQVMAEIFEMMTGRPRSDRLRGDLCRVSKFIEDAKKRNVERGRRVQMLTLPPNWNQDGLYELTVTGREVAVKHRFTQKSAEVHGEIDMPGFTNAGDLYVESNFSEIMATLRSRSDKQVSGILLARIFPAQRVLQECLADISAPLVHEGVES